MEKLRTDVEYRKEYLRLWETQRKPLIPFAVDGGLSGPSKTKPLPKSKQFTSMVDGVQTEPGQSIAEAVVARYIIRKPLTTFELSKYCIFTPMQNRA